MQIAPSSAFLGTTHFQNWYLKFSRSLQLMWNRVYNDHSNTIANFSIVLFKGQKYKFWATFEFAWNWMLPYRKCLTCITDIFIFLKTHVIKFNCTGFLIWYTFKINDIFFKTYMFQHLQDAIFSAKSII